MAQHLEFWTLLLLLIVFAYDPTPDGFRRYPRPARPKSCARLTTVRIVLQTGLLPCPWLRQLPHLYPQNSHASATVSRRQLPRPLSKCRLRPRLCYPHRSQSHACRDEGEAPRVLLHSIWFWFLGSGEDLKNLLSLRARRRKTNSITQHHTTKQTRRSLMRLAN